MYVATESWLDDDGDWIEAGKTVVSSRADCYRMFPSRFKRFTWTDFGRSAIDSPDGMERRGDVTHFLGAEVTISNDHGRYRRRAAVTVGRPYWQLCEPEPWRLRR